MFKLKSDFKPTGDQPQAIEKLVQGVRAGQQHQTLLGVTGSGKTFTMANVIQTINKPTLVLAPNKTLAAQLFSEFRQFFPENAVEYFVSYYDYYQPEAYIPSTNTFIEKDSSINEEIDKLRHSATRSLFDRDDCVIVSSVSCIYGLGSPEAYEGMILYLEEGMKIKRDEVLKKLVEIQYQRNDVDFHRGTFRVRGDTVDIIPAYEEERAVRIEMFGDVVDALFEMDPLRGVKGRKLNRVTIYPATHYVTTGEMRKTAMDSIRIELRERLQEFMGQGKMLEAKRLEQRTLFDLEMMEAIGFCQGIENYSRHLTGRKPGEAPPTLFDYFPKDFLLIIDESHVTIPQIGGMFRGDRARKTTLVEHGFRLPSALDNRPLNFEEYEKSQAFRFYVSATPGDYEFKKSEGEIVEQIIRPTGLVDPPIEIRSAKDQVDNLLLEIKEVVKKGHRVLVTVLTKKLAEDLTNHYTLSGIKVKYLHSDIDTIERVEILRDLREGVFDVLVGINLLREGLDLPEVALIGILDADKEGFLRSERSLIQTIGRAARNVEGRVIMYADRRTDSMDRAIKETDRRRAIQVEYNKHHGITPQTIKKGKQLKIGETDPSQFDFADLELKTAAKIEKEIGDLHNKDVNEIRKKITELSLQMKEAAKNLEFEKAAEIRDRIRILKNAELELM